MTPEILAQWRHDSAVIREGLRGGFWSVLKRHLEDASAAALRMADDYQPDQVDHVMHWRAVRKGLTDALGLPERIVEQAAAIEASLKADEARTRPIRRGIR